MHAHNPSSIMAIPSSPPATTTTKPFTIGVLILPSTQLLDLSPIDLFGMLTPSYLQDCHRGAGLPLPLVNLGVPVTIHYISSTHQSPSPSVPNGVVSSVPNPNPHTNTIELTASAHILSTASLTTPSLGPGSLSALLIPGPDPSLIPSESERGFIRAHHDAGADILTVCTGILVAGHAGVLDGKNVTGPRGLMALLKKKFPKALWVEKRWVRDDGGEKGRGRVWTSGTFKASRARSLSIRLQLIYCCRRNHQRPRHGRSIYPREVQSGAGRSGL